MRVRLVEDTRDMAILFQAQLELGGIEVITSTREFGRLLRPEPWEGIDAAIVDIMLPEVSGLEILRYLAENHPHITRIAATASVPHADDAIGLANHVLLKPVSTADLLRTLGVD